MQTNQRVVSLHYLFRCWLSLEQGSFWREQYSDKWHRFPTRVYIWHHV